MHTREVALCVQGAKAAVHVLVSTPAPTRGSGKVGNPQEPFVALLLHGAGCDGASGGNMDAYAAALCARGGCVAVVRPHMRGTSVPARARTARGVLALARTKLLGGKRARYVLAGHSMGARVAAALVAAHDARTAGDDAAEEAVPQHAGELSAALLLSFPATNGKDLSKVRTEPAGITRTRTAFVRGTADAMASDAKFDGLYASVRTPHKVRLDVPGGGHDLGMKGDPRAKCLAEAKLDAALDFVLGGGEEPRGAPTAIGAATHAAKPKGTKRARSSPSARPSVAAKRSKSKWDE